MSADKQPDRAGLELVSTDALLDELCQRYDTVLIYADRVREERDGHLRGEALRRRAGTPWSVAGLARAAMLDCDDELRAVLRRAFGEDQAQGIE